MSSDLGSRLNTAGAVWLTLLAISWAIRWKSQVPGRNISLAGLLIIVYGVVVLRWPGVFGYALPLHYEGLTRLAVYSVASWMHYQDWQIYRGLSKEERAQAIAAVGLLKRKSKSKKKKDQEEEVIEETVEERD